MNKIENKPDNTKKLQRNYTLPFPPPPRAQWTTINVTNNVANPITFARRRSEALAGRRVVDLPAIIAAVVERGEEGGRGAVVVVASDTFGQKV